MKRYYLSIYFFLNCFFASAQDQHLVDSLNRVLTKNPHDTAKALALAELCFQFRFYNPDSGLLFGRQAVSLSRKIGYLKGETRALSNCGFVFRTLGSLPEALDFQLKALKIAQENNFYQEAGLCMIRLSSVYRELGDFQKALEYIRMSFTVNEKAGNYRGIAISNMILGQTYLAMNQLDSALFYELEAYRRIDSLKHDDLFSNMFRVMGDIYKSLNKTDEALHHYRQAIASVERMDLSDFRTISEVYANMADIHLKGNNTDSAIFYAKQALTNAESISNKRAITDASLLLSKIYEPLDNQLSYQYYKRAMSVRDSILNQDKMIAVQTITHEKEEYDRRQQLESQNYRNRVKMYSLLAGLAIILAVALILYRNNQQKEQANAKLKETLKDLKATQAQLIQSEKMASLGELTAGIAHEIQNPLNFVNNFSEVNKELLAELHNEIEKGNYAEAKSIAADITDNEDKISHHGRRADSIVKGMLQHSKFAARGEELIDINALADEYLRLAYHGLRAKDKSFNARIKTDFDESIGKLNVVPQDIGRVLLNLYNNAFYAVHEKQKIKPENAGSDLDGSQHADTYEPMVSVSTKRNKEGVEISVSDNGNGIPEKIMGKIFQPFFTTKPAGQGTGLGLSLAYDIIKAHGGEIIGRSSRGDGAEFIIKLPTKP